MTAEYVRQDRFPDSRFMSCLRGFPRFSFTKQTEYFVHKTKKRTHCLHQVFFIPQQLTRAGLNLPGLQRSVNQEARMAVLTWQRK